MRKKRPRTNTPRSRPESDFYDLGPANDEHKANHREGDPRSDIAALRRYIRRCIERRPGDIQYILRVAETFVRALAAEARITGPAPRKDLAENLANVLNSLGDQLLPAPPPLSSRPQSADEVEGSGLP